MARVPPANRPHYTPDERMAILELKAARAWNQAQTARAFLVTEGTIASWLRRLDEQGPDALIQTPTPVNKFPDLIRYLVQRLSATLPAMGKARIANMLGRAGLHLSATTVKRMLIQPITGPPRQGLPAAARSSGTSTPGRAPVSQVPATTPANDQSLPPGVGKSHHVIANHPNHVWSVDQSAVPIGGGLWAPWLPLALPQCQAWPLGRPRADR